MVPPPWSCPSRMPGIVVTDQPIRPDTRLDGHRPFPMTRSSTLDRSRGSSRLTAGASYEGRRGPGAGAGARRGARRAAWRSSPKGGSRRRSACSSGRSRSSRTTATPITLCARLLPDGTDGGRRAAVPPGRGAVPRRHLRAVDSGRGRAGAGTRSEGPRRSAGEGPTASSRQTPRTRMLPTPSR